MTARTDVDQGRENNAQIIYTREMITIGPFGIFFSNKNDEMNLAGHSHFAQISFRFETLGSFGFPAFEDTYQVITEWLRQQCAAPFRNATNEEVARRLYETFALFLVEERAADGSPFQLRGGAYRLRGLRLDVRGVFDKIGHADGFTSYEIILAHPGDFADMYSEQVRRDAT